MDIQIISHYFTQYGALAVFVIVLLEYLNLPGFPAGIIMPLAGIWAANGNIGFWTTIFLSVLAGLIGSWALYLLGRLGGNFFLKKYFARFPRQEAAITRNLDMLRQKGYVGVFVSKLLPMIRTIISIPAGMIKMDFAGYTISSALGIFLWNFLFVGGGYLMGDAIFQIFS